MIECSPTKECVYVGGYLTINRTMQDYNIGQAHTLIFFNSGHSNVVCSFAIAMKKKKKKPKIQNKTKESEDDPWKSAKTSI